MDNWNKIGEHEEAYGSKILISRTYELPNGKVHTYDIEKGKNSVGILPITLENKVLCVRQFRPGTEEVYDDLPGGRLEEGELPLPGAERELLEETGYIGDFYRVAKIPKSAYRTTFSYCFVALNCKKLKEPQPDEHEVIEVIEKSLEEFIQQLMSGNLTNAIVGYAGLLFLEKRKASKSLR